MRPSPKAPSLRESIVILAVMLGLTVLALNTGQSAHDPRSPDLVLAGEMK